MNATTAPGNNPDNESNRLVAIPVSEKPSLAQTACTCECSRGGKCPNQDGKKEESK